MGKTTSIAWTDHTFNPWWGCTRVSEGCDHCYAEDMDKHWYPLVQLATSDGEQKEIKVAKHWGDAAPRRTFGEKHWEQLLKWDEAAKRDGVMRKVFMMSMGDILDPKAPPQERERLWNYCRATPNLIKQFLTKRPHYYRLLMPHDILHDWRSWKGFTAENQHWYNNRWHSVYFLPGVRWVSYEPALGSLTLRPGEFPAAMRLPDWIVCGGESGPKRRPFEQGWAESLKAECENLGISFFMKQFGARTPDMGKALIPDHLRIQEFPAYERP